MSKEEGLLSDMMVFLSGPIEKTNDDGVGWRNYIKDKIEEKEFNLKVFDPCDKPKGLGSEIGSEITKIKKLIKESRWSEVKRFVREFRRFDLRGVDTSNFIIVKIDTSVHTCGTYDEIFTAEREGKPILVILGDNQKKEDLPSWLFAFINPEEIFQTEDDCIEYLEKINNNEINLDNRWVKINI